MARIKGKDIYLKDDDQIYFGDNQEAALWFLDDELRLDHTISGTAATQGYHLVRKDQVPDDFLDLLDTPTTYSGAGGKYVRVDPNNPTELMFENAIVGVTSSGTEPPDYNETNLWYNTTANIFFYYDPTRGKWLSTNSVSYLFSYPGNIDGFYLMIGAVANSSLYFPILADACITAVTAAADQSDNSSKGFEIRDDTTSVFSFNLSNWEYSNFNVNVNLSAGAKLKCFCVAADTKCKDPIVTVEIRWRYDVI
jgi:hypothetical protein